MSTHLSTIHPPNFFVYPTSHHTLILSSCDLIVHCLVSDLPDNATDLIGEGSIHPSQYDEEKFEWLLNLDVDKDTADYQAATPVLVQSTIPSTPALPAEVTGSEHTVSPPRFSPDPEVQTDELDGTVSDCTYDEIRKYHEVSFSLRIFFFVVIHSTNLTFSPII